MSLHGLVVFKDNVQSKRKTISIVDFKRIILSLNYHIPM